jgi:hypothetical protein
VGSFWFEYSHNRDKEKCSRPFCQIRLDLFLFKLMKQERNHEREQACSLQCHFAYRLPLLTSGVPKLGMCLPTFSGQPSLVVFSLVLPMGWTGPPHSSVVSQKQCVTSVMQNCNGTSDTPSITWKG